MEVGQICFLSRQAVRELGKLIAVFQELSTISAVLMGY